MSITHPSGLSRTVNRSILMATLSFGVVAMIALVTLSITRWNRHDAVIGSIYGVSLFLCCFCSYLYNKYEAASFRWLLRHLDHAAIFLLIAGTYTPFAAAGISGPFGLNLLYWIWGFALFGIGSRLIIRKGHDRFFVGLYLIMGWLVATSMPSVMQHVNIVPFTLLMIGAAIYTIGALIFARDIGRWTDPVWHGLVLTAACVHFASVFIFLTMPQTV